MISALPEKKEPAESHQLSPAESVCVTPKPNRGDNGFVALTGSRGNLLGAAVCNLLTA